MGKCTYMVLINEDWRRNLNETENEKIVEICNDKEQGEEE